MAKLIGNRYKLIQLIGTGGMADVFLAQDLILQRDVAIKILKDEMAKDSVAIERFKREARSSSCLTHPNIVEIYDVGDDGDKHYIVMEYIKGYTLKKLIDVRGAIPVKESVWLIKQLAYALLEAHKNGIIHRDVKAQNVLIKHDGTVKMADFGIAQAVNDIELTHADTIVGSVHYLAPELTKGNPASMQSDIYALGIVFFELLTGSLPFKGETAVSIALQHVNKNIPSVRSFNPTIPVSVENIITKATAKKVENRYANIALFIKDLEVCLDASHTNDALISFQSEHKENEMDEFFTNNKKTTKKVKNGSKFVNKFGVFGLVCLALLSIFAISALLLISGTIGKNVVSQDTTVPNVLNITLAEASDLLDKYNLKIDYSEIKKEMTNDIEEGLIIDCDPNINDTVAKGTNIKLTISKGIWSKMDNYVGQSVETVKDLLNGTMIKPIFVGVESTYPSGQIITQSIAPQSNYDPKEITEVTFEYSKENTIEIKIGEYKGKSVEEIYASLTEQNVVVNMVEMPKYSFTENEVSKYGPNTVVRITPDEGSFYSQGEDNSISIYYYQEDKE